MKKALIKNSLKAITKNKKRFLSMFFMALLGVGFFAGLTAASPDMEDTLDQYLDDTQTYDIKILATLGITDEDIQKVNDIEEIEAAYGVQSKDYIIKLYEKDYVAQIIEYNENINEPYIIEGRNIENNSECVLDKKFADYNNYKIGDKLEIITEDEEVLEKELTIVGTCESPLYISSERGNTTLGTGSINCYIFTGDILDFDYYTELYAKVEGVQELKTCQKEYEKLVEQAKNKTKEINNSEINKWYIQTRDDNTGYNSLLQAIESITNLARVFPVVFYAIAVLISLTSMTRMVEEERSEIGTLKALGYSNRSIISKYITYASIACILGGIVGMSICFYLFPTIIWTTYGLLYKVPNLITAFRFEDGIMGLGIAFICIVGATFVVCRKELTEMPANLMRPKAPKSGKRVLLERIKIIWNHLSFSRKVTVRNLFRYKKKSMMTIIGITGCTALILAGFGLRDSIRQIVTNQYQKIHKYNAMVYVNGNIDNVIEDLNQNNEITNIVKLKAETGELEKNGIKKSINIIVPENTEEFATICTLNNMDSQEVKLEDNGMIVTEKVAEMLEIQEGEEVTLILNDGGDYKFKVQKIVENYINHYVYISNATYKKVIGEYDTNVLWLNLEDLSQEEQDALSEKMLQNSNIASVTMLDDIIETVDNMLGALDYVIVVLIVSSAILALTVLYNLANVNISERKREIATLKVLGFYDKEVDSYISRESIIFTIIGIILGLGLGYFLTNFIITTCEVESFRFARQIKPISYVYAATITAIFSWIVDFIIHFTLKKIDMIESLKSVE